MAIFQPDLDYESFTLADVPSAPEPFRLLNRTPIVDNGEPLVDLRENHLELSFADYCFPYVRAGVAEALFAASRKLPSHLEIRIFTALRTLDQQAEMYWGNYNRAKEAHPNWPESVLRKMTNRFFAPPDAKAPPGHCTGAAVDVGLINRETGEHLDVRSPIEGWKSAPTAVHGLSPEAAENRRMLCYAMHSTGLSNCRDEFWHWSYGDSAWAVRTGATTACYGLVHPHPEATRVSGGKIELHPYNPEWPLHFEQIRGSLAETVGPLALKIEHVGSTAIPGLSAKPILDINIVVDSDETMTALIEALDAFGYEHQGNLGIDGREAFRTKKDDASKDLPCRTWPHHYLYASSKDSRELKRVLAFRDHLRSNQVAVVEYLALKRALAAKYAWDRTRYSNEKGPFIVQVLREIDSALVD